MTDSPLIQLHQYGEGSKPDLVINVRHDGSFEQTIERYQPYLKTLCPHFNKLELLHKIEEDTGTFSLAKAIAKRVAQKGYRVIVSHHLNSRITVEANRLYVEGEVDQRIRKINHKALDPKLYNEWHNVSQQHHQLGDQQTIDLIESIRKGGIYIDLHSMADHCPVKPDHYRKDLGIAIELNHHNFDEYLSYWQNPQGQPRKNCFLTGTADGNLIDTDSLTQCLKAELENNQMPTTENEPYYLRSSHASYRDLLIAKNLGLQFTIPDLKKSTIASMTTPGIYKEDQNKIDYMSHLFSKVFLKHLS